MSRDITWPTKVCIVKMVFPVVMYGCESWTMQTAEHWRPNWCFWTVVLEKTLESTLDCKQIKTDNPKGNQSWKFIGRTDAKAEAPVFWSSDVNNQLTGKVPDAGKDWGQKENRASEDEMAGWHHRCNEYELGQTPRDGEGQGGLVCCSPWGYKELDRPERLNKSNSNNKNYMHLVSCILT